MIKQVADEIAASIFKLGSEPWDKCQRIQFKGGAEGAETNLGGLCESALSKAIETGLKNINIVETTTRRIDEG